MSDIILHEETKVTKGRVRCISYSAGMVRARMAGRKTQTRRVVSPQPPGWAGEPCFSDQGWGAGKKRPHWNFTDEAAFRAWLIDCPYGQPGDVLVVKEAAWMWCAKVVSGTERTKRTGKPKVAWVECRDVGPIYCADHEGRPTHVPAGKSVRVGDVEYGWHKKNARFLPRWASRGRDVVVSVRVERLQEISEADAVAEGIEEVAAHIGSKRYWKNYLFETAHPRKGVEVTSDQHRILAFGDPRESYRSLWESIHGPGSWERNDWVWVVEFKVGTVDGEF